MLFNLISTTVNSWGTRWRSWLRHCATSRKVAGSLPDGVTGIFHCHNPSGLGLTQHLKEMSTRNISWGLRRPMRWADSRTSFMCRMSCKLGASTSWNPHGLSRDCFTFTFTKLQQILKAISRPCLVSSRLVSSQHYTALECETETSAGFHLID
jgi:hypothetical protein